MAQADELCDGTDLNGFDCEVFGAVGGLLLCDLDCMFDWSSCLYCGNGEIGSGEQCDGVDLQGFDCESLGLGPGKLLCEPKTCTFDTSMCEMG